MNNKELRQRVIDELDFEPSIDSAHIGVAVESGVVTLSGHVLTYLEKVAAERATWRVKGVSAIAQEIAPARAMLVRGHEPPSLRARTLLFHRVQLALLRDVR